MPRGRRSVAAADAAANGHAVARHRGGDRHRHRRRVPVPQSLRTGSRSDRTAGVARAARRAHRRAAAHRRILLVAVRRSDAHDGRRRRSGAFAARRSRRRDSRAGEKRSVGRIATRGRRRVDPHRSSARRDHEPSRRGECVAARRTGAQRSRGCRICSRGATAHALAVRRGTGRRRRRAAHRCAARRGAVQPRADPRTTRTHARRARGMAALPRSRSVVAVGRRSARAAEATSRDHQRLAIPIGAAASRTRGDRGRCEGGRGARESLPPAEPRLRRGRVPRTLGRSGAARRSRRVRATAHHRARRRERADERLRRRAAAERGARDRCGDGGPTTPHRGSTRRVPARTDRVQQTIPCRRGGRSAARGTALRGRRQSDDVRRALLRRKHALRSQRDRRRAQGARNAVRRDRRACDVPRACGARALGAGAVSHERRRLEQRAAARLRRGARVLRPRRIEQLRIRGSAPCGRAGCARPPGRRVDRVDPFVSDAECHRTRRPAAGEHRRRGADGAARRTARRRALAGAARARSTARRRQRRHPRERARASGDPRGAARRRRGRGCERAGSNGSGITHS
jgi:hypothetical protein